MITFIITEFPDQKIVGVEKDGYLIATIYPTKEGIEVAPTHPMLDLEKKNNDWEQTGATFSPNKSHLVRR